MGCGVRAEGAMRGVGCARLRRVGAGERAGRGGRQRSGEGRGHRAERGRRERETASPMVLHCVVGDGRRERNMPF